VLKEFPDPLLIIKEYRCAERTCKSPIYN